MSSIKETYNSTELAKALGKHISSIRRRAKTGSWQYVQQPERLGGNAYVYATLPEDVKAAIAKQEADKAPKKIIDNAVIPDWSHKIGLARFQVVAAWRELCGKQLKRGVKKTEANISARQVRRMIHEGRFLVTKDQPEDHPKDGRQGEDAEAPVEEWEDRGPGLGLLGKGLDAPGRALEVVEKFDGGPG